MADWTIEVDTGAGFVTQDWMDLEFELELNQLGKFMALLIPSGTEPEEGHELKIWWDKGGSQERLRIWGTIQTRYRDELNEIIKVTGYGDGYEIIQSQVGDLRNYGSTTPYAIIQQAGPPAGLLYNAQGNLIMNYATTAPNAITAVAPGNALTFRAHAGMSLLNIARLCEQATTGGGPTYGLEWFVDRSGSTKQFNLVTRRQRAAVYTPETFRIGHDLDTVQRQTELGNDYNRVKVIGEGSGNTRIESSWVGAGNREFVYTDKSISNSTTATNLANRILQSANTGTSPRFEAELSQLNISTDLGDDVIIQSLDGLSSNTYRCLGIRYSLRRDAFTLTLGSYRRFLVDYLKDIQRSAEALGNFSQVTDFNPTFLEGGTTPSATLVTTVDRALAAYAAGTPGTVTWSTGDANTSGTAPATDFGAAELFWLEFTWAVVTGATQATVASHTHDMANHTHNYDKTDTPTGTTDAAGGGAVAEPHAHALTYTSTATGVPSTNTTGAATPNATLQGPFMIRIDFVDADGVLYTRLWHMVYPAMPDDGAFIIQSNTYGFAYRDQTTLSFTPTKIRITIFNYGPHAVTVRTLSQVAIHKKPLHRLNETT